jgi:alpha-glucosidase
VSKKASLLPWWKTAVFYQIYPRSFCDSNGDGVGDLEGIRSRLDYLAWLGVDAIWLSPFYPSPMADFGYDVADYCNVDPIFGSLDHFDRLLKYAHERGIRVTIDWVPNHTSDRHPWFIESGSSRDNPRRNWYVWREGTPDCPPNNWRSVLGGGPAWEWDEKTSSWYSHLFLSQQPDLNWENPEVVAAMHDVLRFWLDRGVDGFRADVIHAIGRGLNPPDFPDAVGEAYQLQVDRRAHELIRGFRQVLDSYPGERMMVGETYILDAARVASYGAPGLLDLGFNFLPMLQPWQADFWRPQAEAMYRESRSFDAWPAWVLSNHDNARHRTRYGSEARARAAAVLLLTQLGTPFLYQGEEMGLEDAVIPPERAVDPGGRDRSRAPIPWTSDPRHGWPVEPWLPWPPDPETRNVESLRKDRGSILHLYRRLLEIRRGSEALRQGDWQELESPPEVLAYLRQSGGDRRAIIVNFGDDMASVRVEGSWRVELASDGVGEGERYVGSVAGSQALLLTP